MSLMTPVPTRYEALLAVRAHFKTEQAMADALGVSQPTVWRWLNQSKQLPPEHVLLAEKLTDVSRHHLRPDYYPVEPPRLDHFYAIDHGAGRVAFSTHRAANRRHVA